MSKVITRYLQYIEELYQIVEKHTDHKKIDKEQLKRIRHKYKQYKQERGAEINKIYSTLQGKSGFLSIRNTDYFLLRRDKKPHKRR
jgi:Fic family protein